MFRLFSNSYLFVPTFVYLLLLSGCGADESVNSPLANGNDADITPAPISSSYFPIALGNRWTYRNPDRSEWSREVVESEVFDAERYHSFSYTPPISLDSLRSAEYLTYADRFVRRMNLSEINDIIWEIILESSDGPTSWPIGMTCGNAGPKPVCETDKNLFRPRIMTLLYRAKSTVVWHSKLILLRHPLLPSQTYNALELRLTGASPNGAARYLYDFKAEGTILGRDGADWESVETPAGRFEKCLKIHYEPKLKSFALVDFRDAFPLDDDIFLDTARELIESELLEELNDLLSDSIPKLGLHTMWLAQSVGPVKIETPDGTAELIDYDIKPAQ
ncbi:MAG: hypothetical protein OXN17_03190 [Candidatus Poribacteria bacterium]|nr:hypothetical protein [Candidatus Poribacteria bacterium]MDE0503577.1 hypothetical protein [Candidatus Poribacteria bacterium]